MRKAVYGPRKFYKGGISLYPKDRLYEEMSFIAYYFHWNMEEIMSLDHLSRRRWCKEISAINERVSSSEEKKEKSIFELKPGR